LEFVVYEAIEDANFSSGQRESWERVGGCPIEHRDPEDPPPPKEAGDRDEIGQTLSGPEVRLLALHPDLRILWNTSIFHRVAYYSNPMRIYCAIPRTSFRSVFNVIAFNVSLT
jgi:hypothetical protein